MGIYLSGRHIGYSEYNPLNESVQVKRKVTINLNDFGLYRNLDAADTDVHIIEVYENGDLTLVSGTYKMGHLQGGFANNGGGICNYGKVTLEAVNIQNCSTNTSDARGGEDGFSFGSNIDSAGAKGSLEAPGVPLGHLKVYVGPSSSYTILIDHDTKNFYRAGHGIAVLRFPGARPRFQIRGLTPNPAFTRSRCQGGGRGIGYN